MKIHQLNFFLLFCCLLIACEKIQAMNGIAVSVDWRYADKSWGSAPGAPENNRYSWAYRGNLVKYTIRGTKVVSADTLHYRTNSLAQYPALSFDGKKVAFYRLGCRVAGETMIGCDGKSYVSVINTDGTGLKNLAELPDLPGIETALDWPMGDWIYYVRPNKGKNWWVRESVSIWRVNVNTGVNMEVFTIVGEGVKDNSYIRRFSLSADGTKAALQIVNGPGGNAVYNFPIQKGNLPDAKKIGYAGSCNVSISPSGDYAGGYLYTAHAEIILRKIRNGIDSQMTDTRLSDLAAWSGQEIGKGGETIRWSVNSDKWVLQSIGWYGHADQMTMGGNQWIVNWVDKESLRTSNNPRVAIDPDPNGGSGTVYRNSCPGDLWVDGGSSASGKVEGGDGVWRMVDPQVVAVKSPLESANKIKMKIRENKALYFSPVFEYRLNDFHVNGSKK